MSLYDPNEFPTDAPVKVSPEFTVADVLAWARTKPADETYCFIDACGCACGQYADFAGIDWTLGTAGWKARWEFEKKHVDQLGGHPRTFGALVKRLEALV